MYHTLDQDMAQGEQEERRPLVESASECSSSLESSLVMSAPGRHKRLLERASPFGSSSPLASTASSFLLGSSSSSIASSSMENLIPDNTNDNLIIPMTLTGEEQQQDSLSTRTSSSSRSTLRPHSSNSYGTLDKEITTMHHAHAHEQEDTFQSSRLPLLNNSQLSSRRHSTLLSPTLWPVSQRASRLLHDQLYDSSGGGADGTYYDNFTTIDWVTDHVKDRIRASKLESHSGLSGLVKKYMDASQAWIVLTLVGVLTGLTASVVEIGTAWLVDLRHGRCLTDLRLRKALCCVNSTNGSCPEWVPWTDSNTSPRLTTLTFTLSGTLLATLSTLLVTLFAHKYHTPQGSVQSEYYAAGSGIPQVKTILGGFILRGCLGLQTLLAKTLALVPAIASGLMIGEQGPIVHISVSIGNVVSRLYHKYNVNEGKRREMLSAASAAGVAVAFGAPLGGVLFALEEVSYYFPMKTLWRTFYCALCAAFTLRLMNPFGAGKLVKFQVVSNHPWQTFEIGPFVLLGLVGGLYGGLFIRLVRLLGRLETVHFSSVQRKMIRVVVVATCTGLLSSLNPLTRLSNVDLILQLFTDCSTPTASSSHSTLLLCSHTSTTTSPLVTLIWTWVVKVVLMTAAFGLHVPGGVFIPCMVIGALNGHILFRLMTPLTPSHSTLFTLLGVSAPPVSPTLYAMLGSASVISGVTRMTVSLSIIMFELTGGSTLHYVVPLMLSVMVAKWVGDAFEAVSVYEMVIQGRGYPYLDHKKTHLVKSGSGGVEEVMDVGVQTLGVEREYGFDEVQEKMAAALDRHPTGDGGFPILKDGALVGYIGYTELAHAIDTAQAADPLWAYRTVIFHHRTPRSSSSHNTTPRFTLTDATLSPTPMDLTPWTDPAPLTLSLNSPMELILEVFIKLGVRMVSVVDAGRFVGVVHKKRLLAFVSARKRRLV